MSLLSGFVKMEKRVSTDGGVPKFTVKNIVIFAIHNQCKKDLRNISELKNESKTSRFNVSFRTNRTRMLG